MAADARDRSLQDVATANGASNNDRCVLEDYTQCSKSHLWRLMMSFYDRKGVESWSQVGRPGTALVVLVAASSRDRYCDGLSFDTAPVATFVNVHAQLSRTFICGLDIPALLERADPTFFAKPRAFRRVCDVTIGTKHSRSESPAGCT